MKIGRRFLFKFTLIIEAIYLLSFVTIIHPEYFRGKPEYVENSVIVNKGKQVSKTLSIAMGGLVRDSENSIEIIYRLLKETASNFNSHHIFFYENDSKDGTVQLLSNLSDQDANLTVITEKKNLSPAVNEGARSNLRFQRMADFRNKLLLEMRESDKKFDLFLIVDTDMSYGFEVNGVLTSLAFTPFNVMCAYGATHDGEMFDTLAFRNDEFNDTRIRHQLDNAHTAFMGFDKSKPIPVKSCFGGLALYNTSSLDSCVYSGVEDCEHVEFHNCISNHNIDKKNKNGIYINPMMVFYYGLFIWRPLEITFWSMHVMVLLALCYGCYFEWFPQHSYLCKIHWWGCVGANCDVLYMKQKLQKTRN